MTSAQKLILVKTIHTLIWAMFVYLIFYVLFCGITGRIDQFTWIAIALVFGEGLVLLIFRMFCPLTLIARKYSSSTKDNFDIYLPNWLARYNKVIFTSIFAVAFSLVLIRHFGIL